MDEPWSQIYKRPPSGLPAIGRYSTPTVPNPDCRVHCLRHEREATPNCPQGHGASYALIAHEWIYTPGHYFYTTESLDGAPLARGRCPLCGDALVRR